ncbi:TonB family protein [Ignatzschineria sp. LJL83]
MKIGSLYVWLALILSVSLNGLIVFWGAKTYRSEVLAISQNAGSDFTAMEFTLAVVASSAHHEVDHNAGDHDDQDAEEDLEKLLKENIQRNDERVVDKPAGDTDKIIAVETSNPDATFVNEFPSEEIKSQENSQNQENSKAQENVTKQETSKPQTKVGSSSVSKPSVTPKPQNTQNPQSPQSPKNAQNSTVATARSGDQFALELASNIHSRIEGCYPESSKRRGEEGIVFLKILNQNAQLSVEIIQSSGFKRLDRCAVSAVEKILPALKIQEVPASGITLKPIRFQLR